MLSTLIHCANSLRAGGLDAGSPGWGPRTSLHLLPSAELDGTTLGHCRELDHSITQLPGSPPAAPLLGEQFVCVGLQQPPPSEQPPARRPPRGEQSRASCDPSGTAQPRRNTSWSRRGISPCAEIKKKGGGLKWGTQHKEGVPGSSWSWPGAPVPALPPPVARGKPEPGTGARPRGGAMLGLRGRGDTERGCHAWTSPCASRVPSGGDEQMGSTPRAGAQPSSRWR